MICLKHGKEKETHRHKPACLSDSAGSYPGSQRRTYPDPTREKNPAAVALGRLGGLKGGTGQGKEIIRKEAKANSQKAAKARWTKNS